MPGVSKSPSFCDLSKVSEEFEISTESGETFAYKISVCMCSIISK